MPLESVNGKQLSKPLKTKDKATANRRLKDDYSLANLDRLTTGEAAQISFEELAAPLERS